jgi:tRNA pseudouridine55 synthase
MHSAIKQDGKPLYAYARAGLTREREARRITIRDMRLIGWRAPDLEFEVLCSKGAYIRVLAEDLASSLGTIAHLVGLRRTSVAPFGEALLWSFEALEALALPQRRALLLPVDAALGATPRYDLPSVQVAELRQGKTLTVPAAAPGIVRIYSDELGFLGMGELQASGRLIPVRLISASINRA